MHFFTCNSNNKITEPNNISQNNSDENNKTILSSIEKYEITMDIKLQELEDAPMLSFEGQTIKAKVVSVYDGDTIKVIFPLKDSFYKWNCRLTGIDTPELRTQNPNEKKFGYEVRDILREKILNKIVNIRCGDFDKYGRLLTDVFFLDSNNSVNDWLIENKYAFSYDGGTKQCWEEYLIKQINCTQESSDSENNETNINDPVNVEIMERDEAYFNDPVNVEIMERDEPTIDTDTDNNYLNMVRDEPTIYNGDNLDTILDETSIY